MALAHANKLDKQQATTFLKEFFHHFQDILNRQTPIEIKDLEKIFSSEFNLSSNGHLLAKSLKEYVARAEMLHKKFSQFEFTGILAEPLQEENKLVAHYSIHLTSRAGQQSEVHIMAIATLDNQKISNWNEVVSEEGANRWDKK